MVYVTITDDDGAETTVSFELVVSNVRPDITVDVDEIAVGEGETAENTGTCNDAGDDPLTLTATLGDVVENGDGTWSWSFGQYRWPGREPDGDRDRDRRQWDVRDGSL